MKDRYLEITYRKGKALAAYLYLSGMPGTHSAGTKKVGDNLIADFDRYGNVIGIEIASPNRMKIGHINRILNTLSIKPVSESELSPLRTA
jgi:uncharacterized protein YuzE